MTDPYTTALIEEHGELVTAMLIALSRCHGNSLQAEVTRWGLTTGGMITT